MVKELIENVTEYLNPFLYFNNKEMTSENDFYEMEKYILDLQKILNKKKTIYFVKELTKTYSDLQFLVYIENYDENVNKFSCKIEGIDQTLECNFYCKYQKVINYQQIIFCASNDDVNTNMYISIDTTTGNYYLYISSLYYTRGIRRLITEIKKVD